MEKPKIAGTNPVAIELQEGKVYAWCSCGQSKDQPFCDGSHKGSGMRPNVFTAEKSGTHYLCMCKQSAKAPFCDGSHAKI